MISLSRTLSLTLVALLTIACAPTPKESETEAATTQVTTPLGEARLSSDDYLQQALKASGAAQQSLLLLATRAALNENNLALAAELLGKIPAALDAPALTAERDLLYADLAITSNQAQAPRQQLRKIDFDSLSQFSQQRFFALMAQAQSQAGMPIEAARALIERDKLLTDEQAITENRHMIWQQLSNLTPFALRMFQEQPAPDPLSGWLEIVAITKEHMQDPNSLIASMSYWKQQYPGHPAADNMPAGLKAAISTRPYRPSRVAILLPQSGRFASQGEVIKQGILHAYLSSPLKDAELLFFDTEAQPMEAIYTEVQAKQADFIIGPLLRNKLEALLAQDPQLPMLALNQVADAVQSDDRYYFALLPEDEARQAALRLWQDELRHPAVIASGSAIGKRMAEQFVQQWQELAPEEDPPQVIYFSNRPQMQKTVRELLGVDQSQQRINRLTQLLNTKVESEVRSRRDIDAIYLIGDAVEARLLKPFVDVNVSPFVERPAVYASSRSHGDLSGGDSDMQNVVISDIPLLLPNSDAQRGAMSMSQRLWPNRQSGEHRLFAFGYDSLSLISNLVQMRYFSEFQMDGYSGALTVDAEGRVNRQLVWAKMRSSGPQRLP